MNAEKDNQVHLTESLEDYIEAIAELTEAEGHAHTKRIADRLNVKMPSVTGAIRQLKKLNYIIYNTHCPVILTPEGKAIADNVIHRHQVLKKFFSDVLGMQLRKASDTACHLEHVVDADTIRRFVLFSEAIERRLDSKKLRIYLSEAMSMLARPECADLRLLTDFGNGDSATVAQFGRNLEGRSDLGISIGDAVTIEGVSLDKAFLRLSLGGITRELAIEDAENIWARPAGGADI